jgi:hypothetical protein
LSTSLGVFPQYPWLQASVDALQHITATLVNEGFDGTINLPYGVIRVGRAADNREHSGVEVYRAPGGTQAAGITLEAAAPSAETLAAELRRLSGCLLAIAGAEGCGNGALRAAA